jgi:hypothetical protein
MKRRFSVGLLWLIVAGCSSEPTKRHDDAVTPGLPTSRQKAIDVDLIPGRWGGNAAICATNPTRIVKASRRGAVYLLRRAELSCFLDATPIGIAGDFHFPARCRIAGKHRLIESVGFNVNYPDELSIEYSVTKGQKFGDVEKLQRCSTSRDGTLGRIRR